MRRLPLLLAGLWWVCAGTCRADDTLPLETLRGLKDATAFVRVGAGKDGKIRIPRPDGRGGITVSVKPGTFLVSGSGFVIQADGDTAYVVTNHHVVVPTVELDPSDLPSMPRMPIGPYMPITPRLPRPVPRMPAGSQKPITVSLPNDAIAAVFRSGTPQEQSVTAELAADDPERDLAVLKVTGVKELPRPVDLTRPPDLVETIPVYVFGFPFGEALALHNGNPTITVGKGTISSIRLKADGAPEKIQIDGALNPGNSGGPIVDGQGRLVGVAVATVKGSGIGLAIPPQELQRTLAGRVSRYHLHATREKESCVVQVEMGLIDPLSRVRDVTFHYIAADALKGPVPVGKSVSDLPGGQTIPLKIEGQKAVGQVSLPVSERDPVSITFQASYRDGDGKRASTPAMPFRVQAKVEAPAPKPPADGDKKAETPGAAPGPKPAGDAPPLARLVQAADTKVWDSALMIVRISYDADKREVTWLVEARKDVGRFRDLNDHYVARFLDEDGAVIDSVTVEFRPPNDYKKGERFRAYVKVPAGDEVAQKAKQVVLRERR